MRRNPTEAAVLEHWQSLTTRERDELVAQYVFMWSPARILGKELPPFSSDLSAAWQVVDAFPALRFTLERFEDSERVSAFFRDMAGHAIADVFAHMGGDINPAEAICMAGLLAAGFDPDEA